MDTFYYSSNLSLSSKTESITPNKLYIIYQMVTTASKNRMHTYATLILIGSSTDEPK